MTSLKALENARSVVFPLDLGEWMSKERLLESITALVEEFNWDNPELKEQLKRYPDFRPKTMLCLLTFAYATGTVGAEEIESSCLTDPFLRYICEGQPPRAEEISRFRKTNRFLLKSLLTEVFKEALKKKFGLGISLLPAGVQRYITATVLERLDLARHLDQDGQKL